MISFDIDTLSKTDSLIFYANNRTKHRTKIQFYSEFLPTITSKFQITALKNFKEKRYILHWNRLSSTHTALFL